MIACQAGEAGKSSGNKYLPVGEIADICHMENVRTRPISQADDQYLDDTPYGKEKAPEAGRKTDAEVSGGYTDNKLVDGEPEFALKDNLSAPPYWIVDAQKVPFDNSKHTVGAEVPSIIISPFVGDRGHISLAQKRKDGICTVEFSRELVTGSQTDVQFDDRNKRNVFGVAVFDNAQVRHAFGAIVLITLFKNWPGRAPFSDGQPVIRRVARGLTRCTSSRRGLDSHEDMCLDSPGSAYVRDKYQEERAGVEHNLPHPRLFRCGQR
jgi:hypothetical protein